MGSLCCSSAGRTSHWSQWSTMWGKSKMFADQCVAECWYILDFKVIWHSYWWLLLLLINVSLLWLWQRGQLLLVKIRHRSPCYSPNKHTHTHAHLFAQKTNSRVILYWQRCRVQSALSTDRRILIYSFIHFLWSPMLSFEPTASEAFGSVSSGCLVTDYAIRT